MFLSKRAAEIWRDYQVDGVPSSGKHNVVKADMRAWMLAVEESEHYNLLNYCVNDPAVSVGEINDAWDRIIEEIVDANLAATIRIPQGVYQLDRTLKVPAAPIITVVCDSGFATRLLANSGSYENGAMMGPDGTDTIQHFRLYGGLFNGNGVAQYGVRFEKMVHGIFHEQIIAATTAWAMRLNGYCNTVNTPKFFTNTGGGLDISGVGPEDGLGNNQTNVNGGIIFANSGFGMRFANGWGCGIRGTGIEGNAIGGLMLYNARGVYLGGGAYCERNGSAGYSPPNGPETLPDIKADIFILASEDSADLTLYDNDQAVNGVTIDGVSHTPYGGGGFPSPGIIQDCFVFATSLDNLNITGVDVWSPENLAALVGTYDDNRYARARNVVIERNTMNNIAFIGTGSSSNSFASAHNISNRFVEYPNNYAPQVRALYAVLSGSTGTLTDANARYSNFPIWAITTGDRVWGINLSLSDYPELKGKMVYFGINYRRLNDDLTLRMYCGGRNTGDAGAGDTTPAGEWLQLSAAKYVAPSDTTLAIAFDMVGTGTILLACPMLCVVGNDIPAAMARTVLDVKPRFSAHKNGTDQTGVADATFTQVTFGTEEFDDGAYFGSNAWTPPAGVVCMAAAVVYVGTIAGGSQSSIAIYKNGSIFQMANFPTLTDFGGASITCIDKANGTDVYTVYIYIDVTSSTATLNGATRNTYFKGAWLGPS